MHSLFIVFMVSLLFGQLGAVRVVPGATIYIHDITLLALIVGYILNTKKIRFKTISRYIIPFWIFAFVALVSILIHMASFALIDVGRSLLYLLRFVGYSLLFVIVQTSVIKPATWIWGLYGIGLLFALLGLGQFLVFPSLSLLVPLGWDPYYYRAFSTLLDPNFSGIMFVLTFFLGLYLWKYASRIPMIVGQILILGSLVLTSSRSSFLAIVVGVLSFALRKKQWGMICLLFVLIVSYIGVPKPAIEAFRLDRSVSALSRVQNWRESWDLFVREPYVGLGFGNRRLISDNLGDTSIPSNAGSGIDSSILFVLATTGIAGILTYLYAWRRLVALTFAISKKERIKDLQVVGMAWIVSLFVHSMFTNSLFYPWVLIYVWVFFGALSREASAGN